MFVRMKIQISGARNTEPWPAPGGVLEVPDHEGGDLIAAGYAEEADGPDVEPDPADDGLDRLKLSALRKRAKADGLDTTGDEDQLRERIRAHAAEEENDADDTGAQSEGSNGASGSEDSDAGGAGNGGEAEGGADAGNVKGTDNIKPAG